MQKQSPYTHRLVVRPQIGGGRGRGSAHHGGQVFGVALVRGLHTVHYFNH